MPGERRPAGGKSRSKIEVKSFLIQQRLAWLANKSNWDGKLPPPKSLSPAATGKKRATAQARQDGGPSSEGGGQAPGWGDEVRDFPISPGNQFPAGTTKNEMHQDRSEWESGKSYKGENYTSTGTSIVTAPSPRTSIAGVDDVMGEIPDGIIANLLADGGTATAMRNESGAIPEPPSQRGDNSVVLPSTSEVQPCRSKLEKDDDGVLSNNDDDEDTAAGDGSSETTDTRSGCVEDAEREVSCSLEGIDHANGGSLPSIALGTNDDAVSDLSCSDAFPRDNATDNRRGNMLESVEDESAHDSSSESPKPLWPATSRSDHDDMSVSHISHLVHERRRWKLRALEAEHELSSMRSPHTRKERGKDDAAAAGPLLVEGVQDQDPISDTAQASASFTHLFSSEASVVGSGFEFDSRWSTISDGRMSTAASSCSTDRACVDVGPSSLESPEKAAEGRLSASTSRKVGLMPAKARHHEAEGSPVHHPATDISDDENDNKGCCRVTSDGQRDENSSTIACHEQKETVTLKEELRKAELRYAAAEATAASVLQRAKAAEISRDVKEIQIRNLEIRLARHANGDRHSQQACTEWRKAHPLAADQRIDSDSKLKSLRPHRTEPLSPVSEEGEEGSPPSPFEKRYPSKKLVAQSPPALVQGNYGALPPAPSEGESAIGGHDNGGSRGAMHKFSRSCFFLGTRAVRAGGEAISAATAAANEVVEETRGRENRKAGLEPRSEAQIDGGLTEEYWGSDYCTSV